MCKKSKYVLQKTAYKFQLFQEEWFVVDKGHVMSMARWASMVRLNFGEMWPPSHFWCNECSSFIHAQLRSPSKVTECTRFRQVVCRKFKRNAD